MMLGKLEIRTKDYLLKLQIINLQMCNFLKNLNNGLTCTQIGKAHFLCGTAIWKFTLPSRRKEWKG